MKWISVKDKLPEDGSHILVIINKNNTFFIPFVCQIENGLFHSPDDDEILFKPNWNERVSHWMPLPEPPKTIKI